MTTPIHLRDDEWKKTHTFLRQNRRVYVGSARKCRRFLEGVPWISHSGAQWRLLPGEYGNWNSVYKRFALWCDEGIWQEMMQYFASGPDMENGILNSTIVRAHPCAAGAQKSHATQEQALGRSRGGFSSKIHIAVDGLGNPLRLGLTAG